MRLPRTAALVRWTGKGSVNELKSSVESLGRATRLRGRVWSSGNSVVVEGPDPLRAATAFGNVPGVSWVAVGTTFKSINEAAPSAGRLARRYLTHADRFSVEGEATEGAVGADIAGAVTSGILDSVKGARVSQLPKVRFRAAFDGRRGVVGVEMAKGPGGVTTGTRWASCLVSGGRHSSVVAWYALLMGFRVELVHVSSTEESMLAVARLYAEMSHRVGPGPLKLLVKEGGTIKELIDLLDSSHGEVFGGFRATGRHPPRELSKSVKAPLYLLPEEEYVKRFEDLGLKADDSESRWASTPSKALRLRRFEGWADDVSAVLDGLQ